MSAKPSWWLIVFHAAIAIVVSLFVMGVFLGFTKNDWVIAASGLVTFGVMWGFLKGIREKKALPTVKNQAKSPREFASSSPKGQAKENRPYRFIFTHSEDVLDAIERKVEAHPKVESVSQDSGFWYSNGETGPEWFSMHVRCKVEDAEEIQHFITALLKESGDDHQVRFMGDYN